MQESSLVHCDPWVRKGSTLPRIWSLFCTSGEQGSGYYIWEWTSRHVSEFFVYSIFFSREKIILSIQRITSFPWFTGKNQKAAEVADLTACQTLLNIDANHKQAKKSRPSCRSDADPPCGPLSFNSKRTVFSSRSRSVIQTGACNIALLWFCCWF